MILGILVSGNLGESVCPTIYGGAVCRGAYGGSVCATAYGEAVMGRALLKDGAPKARPLVCRRVGLPQSPGIEEELHHAPNSVVTRVTLCVFSNVSHGVHALLITRTVCVNAYGRPDYCEDLYRLNGC